MQGLINLMSKRPEYFITWPKEIADKDFLFD